MGRYYQIKCPVCHHTFLKVTYREKLKTATCPYCGYRIDLEKYPQLVIRVFDAPSLRK